MNFKALLILFVLSNAQEKCHSDSDCQPLNSCIDSLCRHKSLFPLATTEYIGLVVMIVVSTIANAGGVGGSSMTISLMLLMHNFDAHTCVALTQVFIFAGTFTATLLKVKDRHPTRDRPLIYYDVLMQIVSPILLGVSVGVMINPVFPAWLILCILSLIVIILVWDVLKRSISLYKKEQSLKKTLPEIQAPDVQNSADSQTGKDGPSRVNKKSTGLEGENNIESQRVSLDIVNSDINKARDGEGVDKGASSSLVEEEPQPESCDAPDQLDPVLLRRLTTIYQEEKKIISLFPLLYFLILTAISIVFSLLKGSSSSKSIIGLKSCSPGYYGLTVGYFIVMIVMSILASVYLVRKTYVCENTNYVFDEGDIRWNYKKCFYVSIASVIAGIVVGLLGMGGGNIIGPILMYLGVRPEIATISSSFTIFISSGTAAAQYFITGVIDFSYSAWFFMLSVIGSLIGILVLRKIAIKIQRVSLLIFCLFFILFASLIIIPTTGIMNAVKQSNQGTFQLGFKSLC